MEQTLDENEQHSNKRLKNIFVKSYEVKPL